MTQVLANRRLGRIWPRDTAIGLCIGAPSALALVRGDGGLLDVIDLPRLDWKGGLHAALARVAELGSPTIAFLVRGRFDCDDYDAGFLVGSMSERAVIILGLEADTELVILDEEDFDVWGEWPARQREAMRRWPESAALFEFDRGARVVVDEDEKARAYTRRAVEVANECGYARATAALAAIAGIRSEGSQ